MLQETAENVARLQVDMVILAILSAGNDYLPALLGGRLQGSSLWESYLALKAKREWAHECVANVSYLCLDCALAHRGVVQKTAQSLTRWSL